MKYNCRVCNTETKMFLDLGTQPIANRFLNKDGGLSKESTIIEEEFYRLTIHFCPNCFTIQLGECPKPREVFNENYPFFTSSSNYMKKHFAELAEYIRDLPGKHDFIVEIGSNDGTFLENFKKNQTRIL